MTAYLPLEKRAGNAAIPLEGGVGIWDGMIPTTSGRNYEFSMGHERKFQFSMSGEVTSGRN